MTDGRQAQGHASKGYVGLMVVALLLFALAVSLEGQSTGFVSSEVHYSDASQRSGLSIVPASCPSDPHYSGECSGGLCGNGICDAGETSTSCPADCSDGDGEGEGDEESCPAMYFCNGNGLYYQYYENRCTYGFVQNCAYGCINGFCQPAPSVEFTSFTAIIPGGGSGGGDLTLEATGRLQAAPALVQQGATTRLYWNASNVTSCTVSGTNGDSWTMEFSGENGQPSSVINEQTTYVLTCIALPEATPPTHTETVIVNVIPVFEEI
jgi:hypothetical protein